MLNVRQPSGFQFPSSRSATLLVSSSNGPVCHSGAAGQCYAEDLYARAAEHFVCLCRQYADQLALGDTFLMAVPVGGLFGATTRPGAHDLEEHRRVPEREHDRAQELCGNEIALVAISRGTLSPNWRPLCPAESSFLSQLYPRCWWAPPRLPKAGVGAVAGGGAVVVGAQVVAAVVARAAVAPRAETAVLRLREVQARRLRNLGIRERRAPAPMLVETIRTPAPGLILMIPIPKIE
jgi:hypothetical protein